MTKRTKLMLINVGLAVMTLIGGLITWYGVTAGGILEAQDFFGTNLIPVACEEMPYSTDLYCGNLGPDVAGDGCYTLECYLKKEKAQNFLNILRDSREEAASVRLTDVDGERLILPDGRPVEMLLSREYLETMLAYESNSIQGYFFAIRWEKGIGDELGVLARKVEQREYSRIIKESTKTPISSVLAAYQKALRQDMRMIFIGFAMISVVILATLAEAGIWLRKILTMLQQE